MRNGLVNSHHLRKDQFFLLPVRVVITTKQKIVWGRQSKINIPLTIPNTAKPSLLSDYPAMVEWLSYGHEDDSYLQVATQQNLKQTKLYGDMIFDLWPWSIACKTKNIKTQDQIFLSRKKKYCRLPVSSRKS